MKQTIISKSYNFGKYNISAPLYDALEDLVNSGDNSIMHLFSRKIRKSSLTVSTESLASYFHKSGSLIYIERNEQKNYEKHTITIIGTNNRSISYAAKFLKRVGDTPLEERTEN